MKSIKINSNIKINEDEKVVKTFKDIEYYVFPLTMIVEGVLNDEYYPIEEISKFFVAWDGRPTTLDHPVDANGNNISANAPIVLENTQLGFLFNTSINGDSLVSEAWIEVSKYEIIKDITEVSTGLFADSEQVSGEFNGESYTSIVRNFKPDHLALLPVGKIGSCNNGDGCGISINEKTEDNLIKKGQIKTNEEDCKCNELLANGEKNDKFPLVNWFKVHELQEFKGQLKANEASFDAKWDLVRSALRSKFKTDENWIGIEAMFGTHVIFWIEEKDLWKFYKMDYTISENDSAAVLNGDKTEVVPKLTYEPVNTSISTNEDDKKDEDIKDNNDNNETGGDSVKEPNKDGEESPKVNEEAKFTAAEVAAMVDSGIEKGVTAGIQAFKANEAKEAETATKTALIETITANEKCIFGKETLEKFTVNELETESKRLGAVAPDYSGNGQDKIKDNEEVGYKSPSLIGAIQSKGK